MHRAFREITQDELAAYGLADEYGARSAASMFHLTPAAVIRPARGVQQRSVCVDGNPRLGSRANAGAGCCERTPRLGRAHGRTGAARLGMT